MAKSLLNSQVRRRCRSAALAPPPLTRPPQCAVFRGDRWLSLYAPSHALAGWCDLQLGHVEGFLDACLRLLQPDMPPHDTPPGVKVCPRRSAATHRLMRMGTQARLQQEVVAVAHQVAAQRAGHGSIAFQRPAHPLLTACRMAEPDASLFRVSERCVVALSVTSTLPAVSLRAGAAAIAD